MKNILMVCCALIISSCYKVELKQMTEEALITDVIYTPSTLRHDVNVGITMNGDLAITPTSSGKSESYAVVFKCKHGKFVVSRKDIWEKATTGMKVIVHYQEIWHVDGNGKRRFSDLDFIDFKEIE